MSHSELQDTALRVAHVLKTLCIPFHITGGLASSYYGEPRLTQDIDFVVNISEAEIPKVVQAFEPHFIINEEAVHEAVRRKSLFQVLDQETYIKADLHVGEAIAGDVTTFYTYPDTTPIRIAALRRLLLSEGARGIE